MQTVDPNSSGSLRSRIVRFRQPSAYLLRVRAKSVEDPQDRERISLPQSPGGALDREFESRKPAQFHRAGTPRGAHPDCVDDLRPTEPHPVFSKIIQYLFGVSHDKIESGCRMILMEAKENPGHKIPRQGCAGCQSDNSRFFPAQIQFAQDPIELGKYMMQSLSQTGPKRSQSHASG